MSAQYLAREREVAIECVSRACQVTGAVFKRLVGDKKEKEKVTETKGDLSPVTVADYSAQAIVNSIIHSAIPADPIVGEEEAAPLRSQEGSSLRAMVVDLTNSVLSAPLPEPSILDAIDLGKYPGGPRGRHWTLDPIDGTKGFLRGEQYAVCLALIVDGEVHLGVMGCPNLPRSHEDQHSSTGSLFVTVKGQGAFQRTLFDSVERPIHVSTIESASQAKFCESAESGHSNHSDSDTVSKLLGITAPPIRMDSQCKYASIARGDASIYLRLPTIKGYEEKIWDHASGWLLVHEAGGRVTDVKGKGLDFSIGRTLKENIGVIATNGKIHEDVVAAVCKVLYGEEAKH